MFSLDGKRTCKGGEDTIAWEDGIKDKLVCVSGCNQE